MTEIVDRAVGVDADVALNEVVVVVNGNEIVTPMNTLGVTIDSSPNEILTAVRGIIQEAQGSTDGYEDAYGEFTYVVRKIMTKNVALVIPKPSAGAIVRCTDEKYLNGKRSGTGWVKARNKGKRTKISFVAPNGDNDLKRIGVKLVISKGKRTMSLDGTDLRSLKSLLEVVSDDIMYLR